MLRTLRDMWPYIEKYKAKLIFAGILRFLLWFPEIMIPALLVKQIFNTISSGNFAMKDLLFPLILMTLIYISQILLAPLNKRIWSSAANRIEHHLKQAFLTI